jgi:hypothetical protein
MLKTFYRAEDVLNWLNNNNPAAAKFGHRIEKISGQRVDTSLDWGFIKAVTFGVLKKYNNFPAKRVAFELYYISSERERLLPIDEIAKRLKRSKKEVGGFIHEVLLAVEHEYKDKRLVIDEP